MVIVFRFMQALADHKFFSENDTVHTYVAKDEVMIIKSYVYT